MESSLSDPLKPLLYLNLKFILWLLFLQFLQNELLLQSPPWITKLRIWDSIRENSTKQNASIPFDGNYYSEDGDSDNGIFGAVSGRPQYYKYPKPGSAGGSSSTREQQPNQPLNKVNIDGAWNPIDTYIYGPTRSTIFNQQPQYGTSAGQLFTNNNNQQPSTSSSSPQQHNTGNNYNRGTNSNNLLPNRKGAASPVAVSSSNWDDNQYYQPPSTSRGKGATIDQHNNLRSTTKYSSNQYSGTNVIDNKYGTSSESGATHHSYEGEEDDYQERGPHGEEHSVDVEGGHYGADRGQFNPYGNINRGSNYAKQQPTANNNMARNNNRNFNNSPQQLHVDGFNRYQTLSTSKSPAGSVSNNNNYNYYNNMNNQRGPGYGQTNPGYGKKSSLSDTVEAGTSFNTNTYGQQRQKPGGRRGGSAGGNSRSSHYRSSMPPSSDPNRKLLLEIYDNESPKLCDHSALEDATSRKMRPCSPLESYVSTGNDMVSQLKCAQADRPNRLLHLFRTLSICC